MRALGVMDGLFPDAVGQRREDRDDAARTKIARKKHTGPPSSPHLCHCLLAAFLSACLVLFRRSPWRSLLHFPRCDRALVRAGEPAMGKGGTAMDPLISEPQISFGIYSGDAEAFAFRAARGRECILPHSYLMDAIVVIAVVSQQQRM